MALTQTIEKPEVRPVFVTLPTFRVQNGRNYRKALRRLRKREKGFKIYTGTELQKPQNQRNTV
jgi:hypothetical protein